MRARLKTVFGDLASPVSRGQPTRTVCETKTAPGTGPDLSAVPTEPDVRARQTGYAVLRVIYRGGHDDVLIPPCSAGQPVCWEDDRRCAHRSSAKGCTTTAATGLVPIVHSPGSLIIIIITIT